MQRYGTLVSRGALSHNVATVYYIARAISFYQAAILVAHNLGDELLIISVVAFEIEDLCLELDGRARSHNFAFIGLGQLYPRTGAVLVVLLGDEYVVTSIVEFADCLIPFLRSFRIELNN